ncbi:efflux RND transporter periplasmic adaptor subunit [Ascidiimonas sp. W6]|uniref:efflux RND transporter periplasmic adaptor subunit n=1 Tax=Ascidiimonas meishanensis TaxID=3128903 RepID=UPI0030EF13E0
MRKIINAILGILLIVGAIFAAKALIASKKKPKPRIDKVMKTVFIDTVNNGTIPIIIKSNGNLTAKNRIELFTEVQGIFKGSSKPFKEGQSFTKGQTLVRMDASEFYAGVQSQKSNLYNLIAAAMPDIRLDYPEVFPKWQAYLTSFDLNKVTPELPEMTSDKERYFINGRGIIPAYYNVKNAEQRLGKYTITAPFNGILTESLVTEGTLVRSGQQLGEFIDPTVYEIEVAVNKSVGNLLKVGKEVKLTDLGNQMNWVGKVIRVNGKVDQQTQTVSAFVEVKGENLKEGMYLEAALNAREEQDAIEISRDLLSEENQIFVVKDSLLDVMDVVPVYFSDKTVVLKGAKEGTIMLRRPVPGAYPGMLVKIYEEKESNKPE